MVSHTTPARVSLSYANPATSSKEPLATSQWSLLQLLIMYLLLMPLLALLLIYPLQLLQWSLLQLLLMPFLQLLPKYSCNFSMVSPTTPARVSTDHATPATSSKVPPATSQWSLLQLLLVYSLHLLLLPLLQLIRKCSWNFSMVSPTTPARVFTASPALATPATHTKVLLQLLNKLFLQLLLMPLLQPLTTYVFLHAAPNHVTTQTLAHMNSLETQLTTSAIPSVELYLMPI
jgi:hypothetical protein